MSEFTVLARKYYEEGMSCSESMIKAAQDTGLCSFENIDEIHRLASMFSGGMSSGCICGALAGSQMILGRAFGRSIDQDTTLNRVVAAEFIQNFKDKRKATCCKVLSMPYKDNPVERRKNCANIIEEAAEITEAVINKH